MSESEVRTRSGWATAWLDAVAFIAGLALAWYAKWQTTDLVWSLWLSSLLVGYAMILWSIFSPGIFIARRMFSDSDPAIRPTAGAIAGVGAAYVVGALFLLAFFTVHFGMFHYVHSVFLYSFFPVGAGRASMPDAAVYRAVLTAYWPFVLLALVAERPAFRWPRPDAAAVDLSVTPKSIAARKAANAAKGGMDGMMRPYRNVIRLHLLIFFFAFASFTKLDTFAVYAVIYAVYFFPWRLLRRPSAV